MKKVLIGLIHLYQKIPGPFHGGCHFYPTCSNYAIEAIEEYGCMKGAFLSIKRILRCHPGAKFGYDPVKRKDKKNVTKNEEMV